MLISPLAPAHIIYRLPRAYRHVAGRVHFHDTAPCRANGARRIVYRRSTTLPSLDYVLLTRCITHTAAASNAHIDGAALKKIEIFAQNSAMTPHDF